MTQYVDLTIAFGARGPDGSYPLTVRSRSGDATGTMTPPTTDPEYQALADSLQNFLIDEAGLIRLGELLFAALFRDQPVRSIYDQLRGATEATSQYMRLRLEFPATAAEAAALPWEFLYDPARDALALGDVSVVRYPVIPVAQAPLMVKLPLKVLLTSAITPPPTEIEAELAEVQTALSALGDLVELTVDKHLNNQTLQRYLREDFHVWHFVGHGTLRADGQGVLLLEDADSPPDDLANPEPITARQLKLLINRGSLRLVVLDACESSKLASDPFKSVAPALMLGQVPAVIAMQFSVPDQTTVVFASEFYSALAQGHPIDVCVNEGRKAVMGQPGGLDRPDWGFPTVYARIDDGRLFELADAPAPTTPGDAHTGGIAVSVGSNNTIGTFQVGTFIDSPASASSRAPIRVPQIRDKDGQLLQPAPSLASYPEELQRLSGGLDAAQKRLAQHQITQGRYGADTPAHIRIEIADLEERIYTLLKERAELRLGRVEELQRARASDQQAQAEAMDVLAEFLDDALVLNRKAQQQLQEALKLSVSRSERRSHEQRLEELRQQFNELSDLSQNLNR